jgi:hypothetical protein
LEVRSLVQALPKCPLSCSPTKVEQLSVVRFLKIKYK